MDNFKLTEQILSQVNTGKIASVVYGHMAPSFANLRDSIIANLLSDYRAGNFDAGRAQASIAQLATLQDLENALKQQMNKGESALARATKGETK